MGVKSITWNGSKKQVTHDSGNTSRHDMSKQRNESSWDGHRTRGHKDWQNFSQQDKEGGNRR